MNSGTVRIIGNQIPVVVLGRHRSEYIDAFRRSIRPDECPINPDAVPARDGRCVTGVDRSDPQRRMAPTAH